MATPVTQQETAAPVVTHTANTPQNTRPRERSYHFGDVISRRLEGLNEEERTCSAIGQGIVELFVSNLCFVHSYAVNSWLFFFGSLCCFAEGVMHFGGGVYRVIKDLFCYRREPVPTQNPDIQNG